MWPCFYSVAELLSVKFGWLYLMVSEVDNRFRCDLQKTSISLSRGPQICLLAMLVTRSCLGCFVILALYVSWYCSWLYLMCLGQGLVCGRPFANFFITGKFIWDLEYHPFIYPASYALLASISHMGKLRPGSSLTRLAGIIGMLQLGSFCLRSVYTLFMMPRFGLVRAALKVRHPYFSYYGAINMQDKLPHHYFPEYDHHLM